jgi:hypothetical protein
MRPGQVRHAAIDAEAISCRRNCFVEAWNSAPMRSEWWLPFEMKGCDIDGAVDRALRIKEGVRQRASQIRLAQRERVAQR